jgi:ABC-type hemin transport system ATPase subunit
MRVCGRSCEKGYWSSKLIREVYGVTSEVSVHPATGKPYIVFVRAQH